MAAVAYTTSGVPALSDARLTDDSVDQHTAKCAAAVAAGQVIRLNAAGKWVLAQADTAPNSAGVYIALRAGGINQNVTGMRIGKMAGLDPTVLPPTAIFLSGTVPGGLDTTAGTVSVQVGRVVEAGVMNVACPL